MENSNDSRKAYDFELNWYDFETRTRKLVFDLLQPTVTRSAEDREVLYAHKRLIEQYRQRMEQVEYVLLEKGQPTTVFERYD